MYFVATALWNARLVYYRIQWANVQVSHDFLWALYDLIFRTTGFQVVQCTPATRVEAFSLP